MIAVSQVGSPNDVGELANKFRMYQTEINNCILKSFTKVTISMAENSKTNNPD